jgi:hypothetical protein
MRIKFTIDTNWIVCNAKFAFSSLQSTLIIKVWFQAIFAFFVEQLCQIPHHFHESFFNQIHNWQKSNRKHFSFHCVKNFHCLSCGGVADPNVRKVASTVCPHGNLYCLYGTFSEQPERLHFPSRTHRNSPTDKSIVYSHPSFSLFLWLLLLFRLVYSYYYYTAKLSPWIEGIRSKRS